MTGEEMEVLRSEIVKMARAHAHAHMAAILLSLAKGKDYPKSGQPAFAAGSDPTTDLFNVAVVSIHEACEAMADELKARGWTPPSNNGGGTKAVNAPSIPVMRYMAVWRQDKSYEPGDVVTHDGTQWHCGVATKTKPGTSGDWQLMAKTPMDRRDVRHIVNEALAARAGA